MVNIQFAERVNRIPPYLFAEIEQIIQEKKRQGIDIISLSIGDPDLPPPPFILEALKEEAANPVNHNYSFSQGESKFREGVAEWMQGRFGVTINPDTEITALMGSKEGLANVARAFINPGDLVLVPNPAYPVYANGGTLLNGGIPISMPLLKQNRYLPQINKLADSNTKMIFLNFPNNPTGAIANTSFLEEIVGFALEENMILCYDNAYSEITFDDYRAPSILEIEGAIEVAIEFHSFSKTFNMTGDRIAFAVGNEKIIEGLVKVKSQIDSGPSKYIQRVAMRGLQEYRGQDPPDYIKQVNATYQRRGKVLIEALQSIGLKCDMPKGTFYIWAECGGDSMGFTRKLVEKGVIATPGIGFGKYGEGYVRFALTRPLEVIKRASIKIVEL